MEIGIGIGIGLLAGLLGGMLGVGGGVGAPWLYISVVEPGDGPNPLIGLRSQ